MQTNNFNAIPLWPLVGFGRGWRLRVPVSRPESKTAEDHERIAKAQAKRERKNAKRLSEAKR